MQRLFSLRKLHSNSNLRPHLCNTFTSVTLPKPHHIQQSSSSLLPPSHPWQRVPPQLGKLNYGFLPKQLPVRRLATKVPSSPVSPLSLLYRRIGFRKLQISQNHSGSGGVLDSIKGRWKSWFRGLSTDQVVMGLIVANVAVFLLWRIADPTFMMKHFMISLDNITSGRLHTNITSAFSHISPGHLISNMIGLYFFGRNIGRVFGPEALLRLYLAGALGGSLFYLVHHAYLASQSKGQGMFVLDPSRRPALGASGAVNAIMLLDIFLFPKATLYFEFIIPVPAILLGIFLIGKDMLRIIEGDSEISGSAHLGGAAVAALAWVQIRRGRLF